MRLGAQGSAGKASKNFKGEGAYQRAKDWVRQKEAEFLNDPSMASRPAGNRPLSYYLDKHLDARAKRYGTTKDNITLAHGKDLYNTKRDVDRILEYPIADIPVAKITADDIHDYLTTRLNENKNKTGTNLLGPTIRRHDWQVLVKAFKHAWNEKVSNNPLAAFKELHTMKATLGEERNIDSFRVPPTVENRLLRQAAAIFQYAIIISIETGVRKGELLALSWENVDLKDRTLRLPSKTTKTKKYRKVQLSNRAVQAFDGLQRLNPLSKKPLDMKVGKLDSAWKRIRARALRQVEKEVFEAARGIDMSEATKPRGNRAVFAAFQAEDSDELKELKNDWAILEKIRWHDFRHEAITRWVNPPISLPIVEAAEQSGHKNAAVLSRYMHTRKETNQNITALLDAGEDRSQLLRDRVYAERNKKRG